ncbi:hypothetical protein [Brevibacillus borstelensis]|uniref:hypothetical protein n=1 Tax=Brevibacillus borstelensis TaxID=45462 RepID=UPI0030C10AC6
MNHVWQLAKADGKHLMRDPMLALSVAAPILLLAVLRFGFPLLSETVRDRAGIDVNVYSDFLLANALLLVALMEGILAGLLMLDERDENMLAYYSVTPLTKQGYLAYRLAVPFLLSGVGAAAVLWGSGLHAGTFWESAPGLALVALEGPLYGLAMAALAANKVEGLAWSKAIGVSVLIPAASLFLPGAWGWICAVFPTFWPVQTFLRAATQLQAASTPRAAAVFSVLFSAGLLYHLLLLWIGYLAFLRRAG